MTKATPPGPVETARLLRLATYASVATATLLILVKLAAWLATGSVSVLASLVDSAMDAGASLVNLVAVHWSLQPPDAEHRFGHGKAQALAALVQSAFIAGSALFVGLEAFDRLLHPQPLEQVGVGLAILTFAMIATLALLAVQRYVIKRTGSPAIRADALHYATDLATNGATLLALGLAAFGWHGVDPLLGLGIGAYVMYSAVRIAQDAVQLLLDRELPEDQRNEILELARSTPSVKGRPRPAHAPVRPAADYPVAPGTGRRVAVARDPSRGHGRRGAHSRPLSGIRYHHPSGSGQSWR